MNHPRAYLKELASKSADAWGARPTPSSWTGDSRAETKNTVYLFRDATCVAVTSRDGQARTNPAALVGMRLVGWVTPKDPKAGLSLDWTPGAYAVLWRPREDGQGSAVALTSATQVFTTRRLPAPAPTVRRSGLVRAAKAAPPRPSQRRVTARSGSFASVQR